jgi:hypothetical protein
MEPPEESDVSAISHAQGGTLMDSLTDLINAAQALLDRGWELQTFFDWRAAAFLSLLGLLGPSHYYTRIFSRLTCQAKRSRLLAGKGVLLAASEEISGHESASRPDRPSPFEANEPKHSKWKPRHGGWCPLCRARDSYKK